MTYTRHNFTENSMLVLLILAERNKAMKIRHLNKAFHLIQPYDKGFGEALELFLGSFSLSASNNEKEIIRNEIFGLKFMGLIKTSMGSATITSANILDYTVQLTSEGKRIANRIKNNRTLAFRPKPADQETIFIACAFNHPEINNLTNEHFILPSKKLGYIPMRVDMDEPDRTITELIIEGITKSAVVIADLTHARPSVYYEIGYAQGLGVPVILTCREDHFRGEEDNESVHFDLRQHKISFWDIEENGDFIWADDTWKPEYRLKKILSKHR